MNAAGSQPSRGEQANLRTASYRSERRVIGTQILVYDNHQTLQGGMPYSVDFFQAKLRGGTLGRRAGIVQLVHQSGGHDTQRYQLFAMQGLDLGPACSQCGGMMQRTGSCYTCSSCGFNTGCG